VGTSPKTSAEARDAFAEIGLDGTEAARVVAGRPPAAHQGSERTVGQILRANILTRFNAILGALLLVVLVVGPVQDGLFGVVLVANAGIGIVQELRARKTLARLAVLTAPRARVVRDSVPQEIAVEAVVVGDVLDLRPGDQAVVDGEVLVTDGLELDESLVTGEAETIPKRTGAEILSGSFVLAGTGRFVATRSNADSYAQRLQADARRFTAMRSELQEGTNRLLRGITWVMVPAAGALLASQIIRSGESRAEALRGTVAGVSAMVPEGLVLLTTIAFGVAAVRLARRRVLVNDLPAIEGLARVDGLCIDKTGTLTRSRMTVAAIEPVDRDNSVDVRAILGAVSAADPAPNATSTAIARSCPDTTGWTASARVPFSSQRKWTAVTFDKHGTWLLGAPSFIRSDVDGTLGASIARHATAGGRVLMLARTPGVVHADEPLPGEIVPVALVVLEEELRPEAPATVAFLVAQGITIKVLSGDAPETVAAVSSRVGLHADTPPVDARTLPPTGPGLLAMAETGSVFGRIRPDQKRAIVEALQAAGHVVAMTGDGVNDVPALKQADLSIAMGSGSQASRAVSRLVLLDSEFAAVPAILHEGRRVIANIERVANLFVTKTVYAALLAVVVAIAALPYPLYARQLTLVSSFTIGIPAFFLAFASGAPRARPGFMVRVLRFALPAGIVTAVATLGSYLVARATPGTTPAQAHTAALITLAAMGLWILTLAARPLDALRVVLVTAMSVATAAAIALPLTHGVLSLDPPSLRLLVWTGGIVVVGMAAASVAVRSGRSRLGTPATRRSSV
jgi:cation-transporting P-type ATPase E